MRERNLEICNSYIEKNPHVKDIIECANFAYHYNSNEKDSHKFFGPTQDGESKCLNCGRTRWSVRWEYEFNNVPYRCQNYVKSGIDEIKSIIKIEEQMFEKLINKAKQIASEIEYSTLTGEYLSVLHHTHGIDPSMLECALLSMNMKPIPESIMEEYNVAYENHKQSGKLGQKIVQLKAK